MSRSGSRVQGSGVGARRFRNLEPLTPHQEELNTKGCADAGHRLPAVGQSSPRGRPLIVQSLRPHADGWSLCDLQERLGSACFFLPVP